MTTTRSPSPSRRVFIPPNGTTRVVADAIPKTEIGKLIEAKRLYRMGWSDKGIAKRLEMDLGFLRKSLGIYDEGRA